MILATPAPAQAAHSYDTHPSPRSSASSLPSAEHSELFFQQSTAPLDSMPVSEESETGDFEPSPDEAAWVVAAVDVPPRSGGGRSPIPPERLAKLANAFGVSTPVPTSAETAFGFSPVNSARSSATRFLLHVIPPDHLAVDSSAAAQMRRGALVPLHSALRGQMNAIAREYRLPSTTGMVLYLVHAQGQADLEHASGPRISEEAWKLLWQSLLRLEREDALHAMTSPRSITSPVLHSPVPSPPPTLHDSPTTEEPTTTTHQRALRPLNMSQSTNTSTSTPRKPLHRHDTSSSRPEQESMHSISPRSSTLSLSLGGSSFVSPSPIVGKIEFDIERHKAAWYDPWRDRTQRRYEQIISPSPTEHGYALIPLRLPSRAPSLSPLSIQTSWSNTPSDTRARSPKWPGSKRLTPNPGLTLSAALQSTDTASTQGSFVSLDEPELSSQSSPEESPRGRAGYMALKDESDHEPLADHEHRFDEVQLESLQVPPLPDVMSESGSTVSQRLSGERDMFRRSGVLEEVDVRVGGETQRLSKDRGMFRRSGGLDDVLGSETLSSSSEYGDVDIDGESPQELEYEDSPADAIQGDPLADVFSRDEDTWAEMRHASLEVQSLTPEPPAQGLGLRVNGVPYEPTVIIPPGELEEEGEPDTEEDSQPEGESEDDVEDVLSLWNAKHPGRPVTRESIQEGPEVLVVHDEGSTSSPERRAWDEDEDLPLSDEPRPLSSETAPLGLSPEPILSLSSTVTPSPEPILSLPSIAIPSPEPALSPPSTLNPSPEPMLSPPSTVTRRPSPPSRAIPSPPSPSPVNPSTPPRPPSSSHESPSASGDVTPVRKSLATPTPPLRVISPSPKSSPLNPSISRRQIPPRLKLSPGPLTSETHDDDGEPAPSASSRSSSLPYLDGKILAASLMEEGEDSPRASQLLMQQQLDDIEKAYAHLSPRELDTSFLQMSPDAASPKEAMYSPTPSSNGFNSSTIGAMWPSVPVSTEVAERGLASIIPQSPTGSTGSAATKVSVETQRRTLTAAESELLSSPEMDDRVASTSRLSHKSPEMTQGESSRFSADSHGGEAAAPSRPGRRRTNSVVSVKSIRRLWKKGAAGAIQQSSDTPPMPSLPKVIPPRPESRALSPRISTSSIDSDSRHSKRDRDSGLDHFRFDQDARLSSRSPLQSSLAPSPIITSSPPTPTTVASMEATQAARTARTKSVPRVWTSPKQRQGKDEADAENSVRLNGRNISAPLFVDHTESALRGARFSSLRSAPRPPQASPLASGPTPPRNTPTPTARPDTPPRLVKQNSIRRKPVPDLEHREDGGDSLSTLSPSSSLSHRPNRSISTSIRQSPLPEEPDNPRPSMSSSAGDALSPTELGNFEMVSPAGFSHIRSSPAF